MLTSLYHVLLKKEIWDVLSVNGVGIETKLSDKLFSYIKKISSPDWAEEVNLSSMKISYNLLCVKIFNTFKDLLSLFYRQEYVKAMSFIRVKVLNWEVQWSYLL